MAFRAVQNIDVAALRTFSDDVVGPRLVDAARSPDPKIRAAAVVTHSF